MIKTEQFVIRTIEENDVEFLHSMNSQEFRGDFEEFQFESKCSLTTQYHKDGFCSDTFQMLVVESLDKKPLGFIYLNFIRVGFIRIGIVLCENCRGMGLGKQITKTIVHHLFDNYTVVRMEADTDIDNLPAQKVLEGAGFVKEGVLRNYRYHHGKYHDSFIYSIIK